MIPASPAVTAPPVKKQRAGNTPEDPISAVTTSAINYRSERLQDLAKRYGTATRIHHPTSSQNGRGSSNTPASTNSSIVHIQPQSRRPGESMRGGGRPSPNGLTMNTIGVDPTANHGPPHVASNHYHSNVRPPAFNALSTTETKLHEPAPPPKPGMASIQPRRSDIFPSVSKQSPYSSKPSLSIVGSAVDLKDQHAQLYGSNVVVARRLENSFQSNGPDPSRSKSAPPTRPPPPPGPPPLIKEELSKVVTFKSPQSFSITSPQTGSNVMLPQPSRSTLVDEKTGTPDDTGTTISASNAGATPFYSQLPPGATPYRSNATEEIPTPPTTARRDLLRNMREFAESPDKPILSPSGSNGEVKSPELRLHEELASSEKDKALALRKVAQLEEEIEQMKSLLSNQKNVGFMSPVANVIHSPIQSRNRRRGTPHPKSNLPKPTTPIEIVEDRRCLLEASKVAPFEYDSDDGISFIVRRPYGLAMETDLWYKVGQLASKLYAKSANVEDFATIEVAATIDFDDSIFILFGESCVRHQSNVTGLSTDYENVEGRSTPLGSITYVDKNAIDKEYSLDELYEFAVSVRGHYCTTVRSFAAALQLHPETLTTTSVPPPTSTTTELQPKVVETADKAVATDAELLNKSTTITTDDTNKLKLPPPPTDDDANSDLVPTFVNLFFSAIFGTIWLIVVKIPMQVLRSTVSMALSAILLAYVWLFF